MGDAADDLFDQHEDFDLDGDEIDITKCCDRCGAVDLHWQETKSGWRLFNERGDPHDCQTATFDGFERII
jgi:hypothetical protein